MRFDRFDLEPHSECDWDHVLVYDGPDMDSDVIGARLCGSETPDEIQSTTRDMYLVFVSDFTAAFTGFHATVTFINGNGEIFVNELKVGKL